MYIPDITRPVLTTPRKPSISRLAVTIALAGFSLAVHAGKITSIPSATVPGIQDGFGGLNLDNLEIVLHGTDSAFDPLTGAYAWGPGSNHSYIANVYDDENQTTLMGHVVAKPYPIGEPTGIKIVNDDFDVKQGKPSNCIMSTSYLDGHYLDDPDPQKVLCSGPFQSHKRYKEPILPSTVVDGAGNEKSLDLVFNVEAEAGSRDYQVFQKINNWTDGRLEGFTIEVGFGTGTAFIPASAVAEVGVANLSLSVPSDVWDAGQLANFSTGLFGPIDTKHGRPAGFFDPNKRAGFFINEYPTNSGQIDKLTSGTTLGSAYAEVPPGAAVSNQFGKWLPNNMLPYGIFFDNDGNPDTDADLVAWYGYNPDPLVADFGWMKGSADSFAVYPDQDIINLGADPLYSMGVIDDLVNVGLNYIVTVGDVSAFPGGKFTIHITPKVADPEMPAPGYVAVGIPPVTPVFTSSDAIITLTPSPEFVPGSLLTARVGDADLNQDPLAIETATIDVQTNNGSVATSTLTLEELGPDRGVFVGNLPEKFSNVDAGTIVTVTYIDASGGTVPDEPNTASSTAVASLPTGLLQFNPASYTVAEDGGSVTVTVERSGGSTGAVSVEYNTKSGTAIGNEDFVPDTASLFFADGETSQTIQVGILYDTIADENDESFSIILSNAQGGATIGAAASAEITITNVNPPVTPPGSSDDGGGWCSYNPDGRFDPILPGMILAALAYLGWRLKKRA